MEVHTCIHYGQLACFERHYECWKVYKGFSATYAPLQMTCISIGQCKTTYCSYYTTAWLRTKRGLPAVQIFHLENIWRIIQWKICQRWPQTLQQLETYIRQEWDQTATPKLQKLITSIPRHLQTVLKRRGDVNDGKHAPVPTILRPVQASNFKWAHFVIHVLLWMKYWLMWFEIILVFILFKFEKRPNISGIQVVLSRLKTYFLLNTSLETVIH